MPAHQSAADVLSAVAPVRVQQLVSGNMYGGGQRVAESLLATAAETDAVSMGLVLLGGQSQQLFRSRFRVVRFEGDYDQPFAVAAAALRLRRLLHEVRPQLLHTHGWDADLIGALATVGTAVRTISHQHTLPGWLASSAARHRIRRLLTKWFLRRAAARVSVAHAVAAHLARHGVARRSAMIVIPNGIEIRRFRAATATAGKRAGLTIAAAGRLMPGKGFDHLLRAVREALPRMPEPPQVIVAGAGSELQPLQRLAEELGLAGHVRFLSHVENVEEVYGGADLYVLASDSEGLPLSLLEAMASGCAVIATRVGGVPEAIEHGVDGLLVEAGDIQGLASAIVLLATDAGMRRRLIMHAAQRVDAEFSLQTSFERVLGVYRSALRQPGCDGDSREH